MIIKRTTLLSLCVLFSLAFSSFITAQNDVLNIALRHIQNERENLKLTQDDIDQYRLSDMYTSSHNGVTHIYFVQQFNNTDVENAIINVNILPNGEILNMGNRFVSNLKSRTSGKIILDADDALLSALKIYNIPAPEGITLKERISAKEYIFKGEGIAVDDIPVKAVYTILEDKSVRLSWQIEIQEFGSRNWWNSKIDAETGELLSHRNQILSCNFNHGNTQCDEAAHSKFARTLNIESKTKSEIAANAPLANSYGVVPVPAESPNHGQRQLVSNPSDPIASPFGWHDTNGVDGPEFTITRGNNVHAYHDIFAINRSIGDEPDGGPSLDFDFPFDPNSDLPYSQVDAAIVNLFYWSNMMHDVWYQYGFDEVSGNFQANNYGKGGNQGDYVRAEALDGLGTNNAFFGTGADGSGAQMQMLVWSGQGLPPRELPPLKTMDSQGNLAEYQMLGAAFGPPLPETAIISKGFLVDDGTEPLADACEDIMNGNDILGSIAVIDRGDCEFGTKVLKAQNVGAIAVIVCNNVPDEIIPMGGGADGGSVNIPSVMVSQADCDQIKLNIADLTFEIQGNFDIPTPGPTGRDGDFDHGIIAHEYTHGISIRLTGGPGTGGCLSNMEQAGEGWSDWFGLAMTTDADNFAEERRGIGTYALGQAINGNGIRPFPYSRDMAVNPHTYQDINNESVPHGVGSVWAVMIWDLYWNLVDVYGFDEDLKNGAGGNNIAMQLVLDGLKNQTCNPTFIDARDAIIAADFSNNQGANICLIWETFARRGLGFDAQPGGIEAYNVAEVCNKNLKIKKSANKEVDAGATITYSLLITNDFPEALTNAVVQDILPTGTTYVAGSATCPNTTVEAGVITIEIGDLDVGQMVICNYDLKVDASLASSVVFEDGIEDGITNWVIESPVGTSQWGTNSNSYEGSVAFFAANTPEESDQYLTLAEPFFIDNANQILSFWHNYNTEFQWDGGVVELSTDGTNWIDLGDKMIQNGYNGAVMVNEASTISGREAFNGNSNGYIQTLIEVGDWLNQDIWIRFRLACDGFVNEEGWYVDQVQLFGSFQSITNQACVSSDLNENVCAEISSLVTGSGTSATIDLDDNTAFSVYPNPTDGKITLDIKNPVNGSASIKIMSMDGRQLLSKGLNQTSGILQMDLSNLGSGMYILIFETENVAHIRKIVLN
jgi:uncharacterized repeat protein (TIGR01451 family)